MLCLLIAFSSLSAHAARGSGQEINGAFGFVLGQQFPIAQAAKVTRRFDGFTVCKVNPSQPEAPFNDFELTLAPQTDVIVSITGRVLFPNESGMQSARRELETRLASQYGKVSRQGANLFQIDSGGRRILGRAERWPDGFVLQATFTDLVAELAAKKADVNDQIVQQEREKHNQDYIDFVNWKHALTRADKNTLQKKLGHYTDETLWDYWLNNVKRGK